jgi:hypothetical protein
MTLKVIRNIAVFAGIAAVAWHFNPWKKITHEPGILVRAQPKQIAVTNVTLPEIDGWKFDAVAEYQLKGRVLGTKRYRSGFGAKLVPIDIAVGWGKMSDQKILDQFELSMSNRFFFYKWEDQPAIPPDEIKVSAANNHIIAATPEVKKVVRSLVPGHIVTMKGYLVNASGPNGATWNSSTTRDDTGNGACEVFYVTEASAVESLSAEMDAEFASR